MSRASPGCIRLGDGSDCHYFQESHAGEARAGSSRSSREIIFFFRLTRRDAKDAKAQRGIRCEAMVDRAPGK